MEGGFALCEENRKFNINSFDELTEELKMQEQRASLGKRSYRFMSPVYLMQGLAIGLLVSPYSVTAFTFNRVLDLGILSIGTYSLISGLAWLIKLWLPQRIKTTRESVLTWFWRSMLLSCVSIMVLSVLFCFDLAGEVTQVWGITLPPLAFLILAGLCNFGLATVDVVCDNLSFDVLDDKHRGFGEMAMWAPMVVGVLMGEATIRFITPPVEHAVWVYSLVLLLGGILMFLLGTVAYRVLSKNLRFEAVPEEEKVDLSKRRKIPIMAIGFYCLLAVLIFFGYRLNANILHPWMEGLGYKEVDGSNFLVISNIAHLIGIGVAGLLSLRFGKNLLVFCLALLIAAYSYLIDVSGQWAVFSVLAVAGAFIAFAEGMVLVTMVSYFRFVSMKMRIVSTVVIFQFYMLVLNAVRLGAPFVGALLKEQHVENYETMFYLPILPLSLAICLLILAWLRGKVKEEFGL